MVRNRRWKLETQIWTMHVSGAVSKIFHSFCNHALLLQKLHESPVPGITVPTNCQNQPMPGKAFCPEHTIKMEKKQWPTNLRQFIEKCQNTDVKKRALQGSSCRASFR